MNGNFREDLKSVPTKQDVDKSRKVDAYREFLSEALPGYIKFMMAINYTITELENSGVIGKTSLKTRVKAVNSALVNTEEKALDDVFGFKIVTQNERDKEVLMLVIHNLFVANYIRQKNHNKSNGYFAHHCTGAVKRKLDGTEVSGLENHILTAETNELKEPYRDMSNRQQKQFKRSEIFGRKPRYPTLRTEILKNGGIDPILQEDFRKALEYIDKYLSEEPDLRRSIPVIEIQFTTKDVEQEAKYGRAQHVKYKKVNEEKITQAYYDRKLVRGVNFPFIFFRNDEGDLEIEHTSDTLINMWPFLEDAVVDYHQIHSCPVANYDMYFAKIFPSLQPFVQRNLSKEPSIPVEDCDLEMAWGILKNKIINESFVLPDSDDVKRINRIK